MWKHGVPKVSVILNTYNRVAQVGKAIETVLSQAGVDLELVVVDDGSTDDTQAALASVTDARMRYLRQSNRGLSAARNVGAREAQGEWLLFLDDDDRLCEGALEALLTAANDPACRVVVGGVRYVRDGEVRKERAAASLDHALAGSFLINRTLFYEAGGYLEGMPCSHQTELFLRVRQVLCDRIGSASFVARPVVELETRPLASRPQRSPANAYFGGLWLVARHSDQYTGRRRATIETIAGVNAMQMGREADARRRFALAIRYDPLSPGRYLRLGGASLPPIGRRVWVRQRDSAPEAPRPLKRVRRPANDDDSTGRLSLERDPSPGPDSLFMPWRYRENTPESSDEKASPFWRDGLTGNEHRYQATPMYKLAARLVRAKRLVPVVDIGCGSGHNLVRSVGRLTNDFVGFDEPSGISIARQSFPDRTWIEGDLDDEALWNKIASLRPQLVICSQVVEHVFDPRRLLSGIRCAVSDGGFALISTSDRTRLQPEAAMGPPTNPRHIREWSADEFALLLESCGFEVVRLVHRLPRAYSPTAVELKHFVWRALHLKAVPDRRSSMGFLVRAARNDSGRASERELVEGAVR
jgi:SAM-dependent methyltransferase